MAIDAYRFFSNNCREAMTRYHEVLGGELSVMSFADMPPGEDVTPDVDPDLVMHASLVFPDGDSLLASDDPSGDGGPATGVALSYTASSIDDAHRVFDALADGGSVDMPLEAVFWSPLFGTLTDRFGTAWMIGVGHPQTGG